MFTTVFNNEWTMKEFLKHFIFFSYLSSDQKESKSAVNVLRSMVKVISRNLRETSCELADELAV